MGYYQMRTTTPNRRAYINIDQSDPWEAAATGHKTRSHAMSHGIKLITLGLCFGIGAATIWHAAGLQFWTAYHITFLTCGVVATATVLE